jgi:hypothetical protein
VLQVAWRNDYDTSELSQQLQSRSRALQGSLPAAAHHVLKMFIDLLG